MQLFILPDCLPRGPQHSGKPTAKADRGKAQRTRETHQRAPLSAEHFSVPSKPNLLWHLGLEASISALGKCNFWED